MPGGKNGKRIKKLTDFIDKTNDMPSLIANQQVVWEGILGART
jgi:hypothetical protein